MANGSETQGTGGLSIDWQRAEDDVPRPRQRILAASKAGDLPKVRNLQKLMLRSRANTLLSVQRYTRLTDLGSQRPWSGASRPERPSRRGHHEVPVDTRRLAAGIELGHCYTTNRPPGETATTEYVRLDTSDTDSPRTGDAPQQTLPVGKKPHARRNAACATSLLPAHPRLPRRCRRRAEPQRPLTTPRGVTAVALA